MTKPLAEGEKSIIQSLATKFVSTKRELEKLQKDYDFWREELIKAMLKYGVNELNGLVKLIPSYSIYIKDYKHVRSILQKHDLLDDVLEISRSKLSKLVEEHPDIFVELSDSLTVKKVYRVLTGGENGEGKD